MTKAAEIALLDDTIARFGPNSYLGPWLAEYRDGIVHDIQHDLQPLAPLPAAAYKQAEVIVAEARQAAAALASAEAARQASLRDEFDASYGNALRRAADILREKAVELERRSSTYRR